MQIYFIIIALFIFVYSIKSKYNLANSITLSLALSIFPLFWVPDSHSAHLRLGGIPIFYLPFFAFGLSFLIKSNLKIDKISKKMFILFIILLAYIIIQSITIGAVRFSDFTYVMSFILNFLFFFATIKVFSTIDLNFSKKIIGTLVAILIISCIIGLLRYIIGISIDTNFIPVVNRNLTVVIIVILTPLTFYLYEIKKIKKNRLYIYLFIIFVALVFSSSRSGLLGFVFILFLYYFKLNIKNLSKIIFIIVPLVIVVSIVFKEHLQRFDIAVTTIEHLESGEKFDPSMNDYSRVVLLEAGVLLIKNNFWLGTGMGLTNYSKEFHKVSSYPHPKRVHNFYLSYFISLGFVGFIMFLTFVNLVYKSLKNRLFKISLLALALMMVMNEYVLVPFLWIYYGALVGISNRITKKEISQ